MSTLRYVTTNSEKFRVAQKHVHRFDISIEQHVLEIAELQSHSVMEIVSHKAQEAFSIVQSPLIVSDHSWSIAALGGFPGPFMKYMNVWLTAEDVLNMMLDHKRRDIVRQEVICYIDAFQQKHFSHEIDGQVLHHARGHGLQVMRVVTLSSDGRSVAEYQATGIDLPKEHEVWEQFAVWYKGILESGQK